MSWQLASPLPDAAPFLAALRANADLFDRAQPLVVARAPGRLDVMGGIADYSGALVLELPLAVATYAAAQHDPAPMITVRSLQAAAIDALPDVSVPLTALLPNGRMLPYGEARRVLGADPGAEWAAYVIGALVVLARERGLSPNHGARLLIDSQVPPGKGVSSSAAIEVAAMQALCALYGVELGGRDLAILCQKVENLVVGAPCGVMDQMTSACGEQDALLALVCQPAELQPPVALPPELAVWGIDSSIRHAVSGADYGSVRVGAFMGYRIIADLAGLPVRVDGDAMSIDDRRWGGYLANVAPSEWEQHFRDHVPETLDGTAFLDRYGGITDMVTAVDPARTYAVRQPTAHPIYEHARVRMFRALLQSGNADQETYALLGELMFQSHASYSACGLGSGGTDRLVEMVRALGPSSGVYGAKITGGGSGGTVAVLAHRDAADTVQTLATQYRNETGMESTVIHGSSPGAKAFGVAWLEA